MTFHTPIFLWGMLTILIPISIHFIGKTPHNKNGRRRILLFTRILVITTVVIMFARPVIQGKINNIPLGEIESKIIIIVDNSASVAMTTVTGESLLENAKMQAKDVVKSLEGLTTIDIYQTCPFKKIYSGDNDSESIKSKLNSINQSMLNDELWSSVNRACRQVSADYLNYECIIISDFPGENLPGNNIYDKLLSNKIDWQYYLLTQSKPFNNVSIKSAKLDNEYYFAGSTLKINSLLVNESNLGREQVTIQLITNSEASQIIKNFNSRENENLLFQFIPEKRGLNKGEIKITDDDYSLDNKLQFDFVIPSEIRCMAVSTNADDALIINTALESITKYANEIKVAEPIINEMPRLQLDNIDVLILNNISTLTRSAAIELKNFINNGGGVVWFPGREWEAATIGYIIDQIPLIVETEDNLDLKSNKVSINDYNHSLFTDLHPDNLINELPSINSYYKTNKESLYHSIMNISQDEPFLLELFEGSGSILLFTSPLDMNWNDFAISGFFTPFLYRMIVYLKKVEGHTDPITVGNEKFIALIQSDLDKRWSLETPSGEKHIIIADFNEEALIITETSELGRYHVFANGKEFTSFSTRLHPSEYPSNRINITKLKEYLPSGSVYLINHNESIVNKLKAIRYGRPLWRQFLIAFIILLVIETFITRSEKPGKIQHS